MKNNRRFLHIILAILLVASVSLFFYKKSFALLGFGGMILTVSPCDNGILLLIGPPRGGLFLLPPGARIYPFFSIKPGSWTLGGYLPTGACVIGPVVIPTQGTILMVGTSR